MLKDSRRSVSPRMNSKQNEEIVKARKGNYAFLMLEDRINYFYVGRHHQEYKRIKRTQIKLQALYTVFFKQTAKLSMKYFFRWKLLSQMDVKLYQRYLQRTIKIRYLIKLSNDRYFKKIKDFFFVWYFQTKQAFPFYSNKQPGRVKLMNLLEKIISKEQEKTNKRKPYYIHELYLNMEKIALPLEKKFSALKIMALRQFKCLYDIEQIVIKSQQSIMVRTLSINMELYFNSFKKGSSKRDIGPRELLNIMEHAYIKKDIRLNQETDYLEKFFTKMELSKTRVRDSDILVTGIWASANPLFRLREYIFVKMIQRTYIKWTNVSLLKLRFNRQLGDLKDQQRNKLEGKNNKFRKTWARIFISYYLQSKVEKISSDVLIAYEYTKKKRDIDNTKADALPNLYQKQLMQLQEIPDYEEVIKESFKKRLADMKKLFAKKFLSIILKPGEKSKEVKKELISLLVDTLFYVTCGTLQSVNNTPREPQN